jgi:hypothetical protein
MGWLGERQLRRHERTVLPARNPWHHARLPCLFSTPTACQTPPAPALAQGRVQPLPPAASPDSAAAVAWTGPLQNGTLHAILGWCVCEEGWGKRGDSLHWRGRRGWHRTRGCADACLPHVRVPPRDPGGCLTGEGTTCDTESNGCCGSRQTSGPFLPPLHAAKQRKGRPRLRRARPTLVRGADVGDAGARHGLRGRGGAGVGEASYDPLQLPRSKCQQPSPGRPVRQPANAVVHPFPGPVRPTGQ